MKFYLVYLIIINIITFILYGSDKRRAVKGRCRIRESVLLWIGIMGGAVGGLCGMAVFHHKTLKPKFRAVNIVGIIIHTVIIIVLYYV